MMNFNQSALSCDLESTPKQVSFTPLSAYALPSQPLSGPPSPLPQVPTKSTGPDTKMANSQSAQYIICCKCGKRRAVPS